MKVGVLLKILKDVVELLENLGLLNESGDFIAPTFEQDTMIAARVEGILKNHGVTLPDQIDKVLAILPLTLSLAGVK